MSSDISKNKKAEENKPAGIELPQGAEITPDIPDGVSEDVYRFWKENGSRIILYCVVAVVTFLGVQGWKQFVVSKENSIRTDFAALETTDAKLDFAKSHKGHALAGYAYLQAAKEAYEADDFSKASEYYDLATPSMEGSKMLAVALLGSANSKREAGDEAGAISIFEKISSNEEFAEGIRAEAMFKRIIIALKHGENDVVDDYTAQLEAIDDTRLWAQRLESVKYYQ